MSPRVRVLAGATAAPSVLTIVGGVLDNLALVAVGLALSSAGCALLLSVLIGAQRRTERVTLTKLRNLDRKLAPLVTDARRNRIALESELLTNQQAMDQLLSRFQPTAPLPVVAGWAMDPVGLLWLTDYIEQGRPDLIIECGSGTSTLWMGFALRANGSGRLVSLDHHASFARRTRELIERHGLSEWVEVRHSPLRPVETPRGEFQWYGVDPEDFGEIDLLVVDGPPATTGKHARYPALALLGGHLSHNGAIIADDVDRIEEKEMIELWLAEDPALHRAGAKLGQRLQVLNRS